MPTAWDASDTRSGTSDRREAHALYATLLDWIVQYPRWLLGGDLNETRFPIDRKEEEKKERKENEQERKKKKRGKKGKNDKTVTIEGKKEQKSKQKFVNYFLE